MGVTLLQKILPFSLDESISDPARRYVLIEVNTHSETWTFLMSHAPNYNDQSFIQEIFLKVSESSGNILIGGDFNFCLDPVPHRSSDTAVIRSTAARSISAFMKSLNLCDTWRHFYSTTRHHYSCPRTSHTRGD